MDGRRLKSIILVVLLAANLVLAAILGMRSYESRRLMQQAADDTLAALSRMGMTATRSLLMDEQPAIYPSELEHQPDVEASFTREFVRQGSDAVADAYITDGAPSKSLAAALLALAAYLDDASSPAGEVLAVELGWTAELAAPGYTRLQPTWRILTEAGGFYVDAMTLAVSGE